jgi:RecJ-like exonuclease
MYKSNLDKYIKELEETFDDKLDVVGEHISSESGNYALGAYGKDLKAIDTGNYTQSFNYNRPDKLTVNNGNSADYSNHIEFGTNKMKPRPIQQTVIDSNDSEILDILSR